MKGYYHSKETFGTVDGPGIRYVLFLAGCGLGCAFCHNPDTWQRGNKTITVEEVLEDIEQYKNFYELSGGGITISGGEPLLQPDFVAALFKSCKNNGIHTVLDTAGYCTKEAIKKVLPYTDQVLFSIKAIAKKVHRKLTLADNDEILANFRYIASQKPMTLRYVIVPGINDSDEAIDLLIDFINTVDSKGLKVDLLPYHKLGVYKWTELDMEYKLTDIRAANNEDVKRFRQRLEVAGIQSIT